MPMTISMDDALKADFSQVCSDMGMSPSTAFGIFARTVVRERCIPFTVSAERAAEREARAFESKLHAELRTGYDAVVNGNCLTRDEVLALRQQRGVA